jgi:hypothetical protein
MYIIVVRNNKQKTKDIMITFTFKTNGGPQEVEITDERVAKFIEATRHFECYGENSKHPIDFCQIAYQLYLDDEIDKEYKDYLIQSFTEIMKNFKYDGNSVVCDIPEDW